MVVRGARDVVALAATASKFYISDPSTEMTTPVDESTQVGYCVAADVYCSFTEYYGNGTVYGWRHLYIGPDVVRGAGRTKRDLIAAGAVQEEAICPAVPADVLVLPLDPVPEAVPPEAPVFEAPPAPEAPAADKCCSCCDPCRCDSCKCPLIEKSVNKITLKFKGFSVSLNTKVTADVNVDVTESGEVVFTL